MFLTLCRIHSVKKTFVEFAAGGVFARQFRLGSDSYFSCHLRRIVHVYHGVAYNFGGMPIRSKAAVLQLTGRIH